MFHAKNYFKRPMFHGFIQKITLAVFLETWCTISQRSVINSENIEKHTNLGICINLRPCSRYKQRFKFRSALLPGISIDKNALLITTYTYAKTINKLH